MQKRKLSHYEIIDKLGEGGMGEVYRARDTKLSREVAIKVLPAALATDAERRARFEREARTLATLQHANIASIYGFDHADNTRFLVMELVDGEDLSARLHRGAIPVEETVELAHELAAGLSAAHAVGITHRDLKPANIKLTPDGGLKILDFGLARAYNDDPDSDLENSPTITSAMTQDGVILGTAAYMSPEQARGKRVDHRSDIWAFGAVVVEMLIGRRLFDGETVSDTLAGVLRAEIPWDELPKKTPPALRRMLRRCLDRDRSRRLQAIAEARITLEDIRSGRADETVAPAASPSGISRRERTAWGAVLALAVFGFIAVDTFIRESPQPPVTHSTIMPPEGWDFAPSSPFSVSPDGRRIAFDALSRPENTDVARGATSLWVRDLGDADPRQLTGIGGAYPFWSPDGKWIGFFAGGKLNKIEARGGPVIPLAATNSGRGGSWNRDGVIIFQATWSEGLVRMPAGGGTPEPLTTLNTGRFDVAHRWPQFLPDGKHFIFYVVSTTNTITSEHSGIYLGSLDSNETRLLLRSESRGLYAQGHLFYRTGTTLMARPFDPGKQEFLGDATPVATDIPGGAISWGGAHFGVSEGGSLVYMRGASATSSTLQWRDRSGGVLETIGDAAGYWEPSLSHDGTRIAMSIGEAAGDIWVHDLERNVRTRFTFDSADDRNPAWAPDDSRIVFDSGRKGASEIYVRPTSGQGDEEMLYESDSRIVLCDWSPDGRIVIFTRLMPGTDGWDVFALDVESREASPLVTGPFHQLAATLSPDGRWLAYQSDESGTEEVYVQAYPRPDGRWMLSNGGGLQPVWARSGGELFYLSGSGNISAVKIVTDRGFEFGPPEELFSVNMKGTVATGYAVSNDGQRILTNELPPVDPNKVGARLVQNWTAALAQ